MKVNLPTPKGVLKMKKCNHHFIAVDTSVCNKTKTILQEQECSICGYKKISCSPKTKVTLSFSYKPNTSLDKNN